MLNFLHHSTYLVGGTDWDACKGKEFKRYGDGLIYYYMKDLRCIEGLTYSLKPDDVKWVEACADLRPHRDHGVSTVVNLYIEPAGAVTTFYKVKEGQAPYKYPGTKVASVYAPHQLEAVDSFAAKRGDVYGLDVTQVHTVTYGVNVRRFVQFSWNTKTLAEVFPR